MKNNLIYVLIYIGLNGLCLQAVAQTDSTSSGAEIQWSELNNVQKLIDDNKLASAIDTLDSINTKNLNSKQLAKYQMLKSEIYFSNQDAAPKDSDEVVKDEEIYDFEDAARNTDDLIKKAIEQQYKEQTQNSPPAPNAVSENIKPIIESIQKPITATTQKPVESVKSIESTETAIIRKIIQQDFSNTNVRSIAVLLPFSGALATPAKAIKQAIITAYYQDPNQIKPEINFIDTQNKPELIVQFYNEALKNNPDVIIGPLDKASVESLNKYLANTSHPTVIALNYTSSNTLPDNNFFQFGISAEDEAEQAAKKIFHDGYHNSLVLADNTAWGERVSNVYRSQFQKAGGKVLRVVRINNNSNLKNLISKVIDIEQSQNRKNTLELVLNKKVAFSPRRRQDFDHIFLVTSNVIAKQVKPILKFYYADNLKVVSTSSIYDAKLNNNIADLDGILFCDIPWIIQNNNSAQNTMLATIHHTWPDSMNNIRLYAMGIDAYNLTYSLGKLKNSGNTALASNTGNLYLSNSNKIQRGLAWAVIQNGQPKSL